MMKRHRRASHPPAELGPNVAAIAAAAAAQPPIHVIQPKGKTVVDVAPASLTTVAQKVMDEGEGRRTVYWYNDGPGIAYVGGPQVSSANGTPIYPNQGFSETEAPDAAWYAVSASTSTLRRQVLQ